MIHIPDLYTRPIYPTYIPDLYTRPIYFGLVDVPLVQVQVLTHVGEVGNVLLHALHVHLVKAYSGHSI